MELTQAQQAEAAENDGWYRADVTGICSDCREHCDILRDSREEEQDVSGCCFAAVWPG